MMDFSERAGHQKLRRTIDGFSLTGLVIVLAVVALLVAVSVPSYQSFVMKSQSTDAHGAWNKKSVSETIKWWRKERHGPGSKNQKIILKQHCE